MKRRYELPERPYGRLDLHYVGAGRAGACYRRDDYARSGLPMLPVTHGIAFTCRQSLIYVVLLCAASAAPYAIGMSGPGYLAAAALLGAVFLGHSIALCRRYSDALARRTFRWSIVYLTLLFAALLVDHFAQLG